MGHNGLLDANPSHNVNYKFTSTATAADMVRPILEIQSTFSSVVPNPSPTMDTFKKSVAYWKALSSNTIDHGDILVFRLIPIMR